jgi:phage tail tape-measure protein
MTVWRGGRGVKAPYESTHVRIPLPIKDKVEALSQAYKDGNLDDLESKTVDLDNAIELARGILKQKKSARVSLENFLKVIYGEDVCL